MCKYCHFLEDGDPADEWDYIVCEEETASSDFEDDFLKVKVNFPLQIAGGVYKTKGEYRLTISVWDNLDPPVFKNDGFLVEGKINYCPICGRKLNDELDI